MPALQTVQSAHFLPQPPQLFRSPSVSTHLLLLPEGHFVPPAGQPHLPLVQTSPEPQVLLQNPQLLGLARMFVHLPAQGIQSMGQAHLLA